jgi:hypothetical protein
MRSELFGFADFVLGRVERIVSGGDQLPILNSAGGSDGDLNATRISDVN